MYLTATIVNAVKDTLLYLETHKEFIASQRQILPLRQFIKYFLTLRLQFPRGSGNTVAAKELLSIYNGIVVTHGWGYGYSDYLSNVIGMPEDKVHYFYDVNRNAARLAPLGQLELVIFDPAATLERCFTPEKISEVKEKLVYTNNVKLFVMLG